MVCRCGEFFHTGNPVVTWLDPGGFNAYSTQCQQQSKASGQAAGSEKEQVKQQQQIVSAAADDVHGSFALRYGNRKVDKVRLSKTITQAFDVAKRLWTA